MLTVGIIEAQTNLALNKPACQNSTGSGGVSERTVGMNLTHMFFPQNIPLSLKINIFTICVS